LEKESEETMITKTLSQKKKKKGKEVGIWPRLR